MRLKEQRLWDRFKRNVVGTELWLNRVENRVGVGDPDVEAIAAGGIYSKVELKAVHAAPARATTALLGDEGLSVSQKNYLYRWTKLGGRSFVLIGVGQGRKADQYLLSGDKADIINDLTLDEVQTIAEAWTWPRIDQILRGMK